MMPTCVTEPSESGDGRAEKPRYDVPQGVGVKNRYEAELTYQRRRSGSKTWAYFSVPHGGAERLRFTAFCRLPKNKIDFSCEIEGFVVTHLCKMCMILQSSVSLGVFPLEGYRSATPLGTPV